MAQIGCVLGFSLSESLTFSLPTKIILIYPVQCTLTSEVRIPIYRHFEGHFQNAFQNIDRGFGGPFTEKKPEGQNWVTQSP